MKIESYLCFATTTDNCLVITNFRTLNEQMHIPENYHEYKQNNVLNSDIGVWKIKRKL